ncbi:MULTISPECIES: hypothetical protein [unclassified Ruegeria]|uniref:hypothetical protein n=1 Tax=unclassified Ruegeria TaxID=2625375 RepID=UPI0014898E51|nr:MULTISPECIES: hypothetical protein [unclassified Ruegeria]
MVKTTIMRLSNSLTLMAALCCPGCEKETAGAAGMVAGNTLVAPLIYPAAVAVRLGRNQKYTVQPVVVSDGSGKVLSPSFEGTPEAEFRVSERTLICSGEVPYFRGANIYDGFIACGSGRKLQVKLYSHYGRKLFLEIGPANVPVEQLDRPQAAYPIFVLGEIEFGCKGNYSESKQGATPFLIGCGNGYNDSTGVVSITPSEDGRKQLIVWVDRP